MALSRRAPPATLGDRRWLSRRWQATATAARYTGQEATRGCDAGIDVGNDRRQAHTLGQGCMPDVLVGPLIERDIAQAVVGEQAFPDQVRIGIRGEVPQPAENRITGCTGSV